MKSCVVVQELQKRSLAHQIVMLEHEAKLSDQETRIQALEAEVTLLKAA